MGYIATCFFFHKADIPVPNTVGKTIVEATQLLSSHHLGLRLVDFHQDNTLPEGTILEQRPHSQQKIKPNQHVFVSVSTHKSSSTTPDLWGKKYEAALDIASQQGWEVDCINLTSNYPQNLCIAQLPPAHQPMNHHKMKLYFSSGPSRIVLVPDFRAATIHAVENSLKANDIRAEIFHTQPQPEEHLCTHCTILNQQPAPGTIVDLSRSLYIQLQVRTPE